MITRQIGWSNESNLLYQILKQITKLSSIIFSLKQEATPKYKVFTALVTQGRGDEPQNLNEGELTIGVTYTIYGSNGATDFTNVGSPNNEDGTSFIATGTRPNDWAGAGLLFNYGAPVAIILENTIGNIWFTYQKMGIYDINSNSLFIETKTTLNFGNMSSLSNSCVIKNYVEVSTYPDLISFTTRDYTNLGTNDSLYNTLIEIRIYN